MAFGEELRIELPGGERIAPVEEYCPDHRRWLAPSSMATDAPPCRPCARAHRDRGPPPRPTSATPHSSSSRPPCPARLADRRSDRARGGAHGTGHRRLSQRHVRQCAGADHRPDRRARGADAVVRGSLTGSVVGNLLLVLGFSLFAGGSGPIERWSSFLSFGMIGLAIGLFLIPSVPGWSERTRTPSGRRLSVPVAIALLVVYAISPSTRSGATTSSTSRATTRSRLVVQDRSPHSASPPS